MRRGSAARTSSSARVHLSDDVEAIQDIERVAAVLLDELEVGLPHIGADELDLLGELLAEQGEELLEALAGAFLADPEQPLIAGFDLVDERQILMSASILNLVHPDRAHRFQATLPKTPAHHILDGIEDLLPTGAKPLRGFLPGALAT